MLNRIKYLLLMIMLMAGVSAMSQSYVIDKVCMGAERHYRVDGLAGSTYTWTLTDPAGVLATLPETGDSVTIAWNGAAGIYTLSTTQHGLNGCDAVLELGTVEVFDVPYAYAGSNATLCNPAPYTLIYADAGNWGSLEWTTSGDGWFDDVTILHPTYTFGANDILNGSVTLTLTANGIGYPGSCPPAGSTMIITLDNLLVDAMSTPASCSGVVDGMVQLTASGGTAPYTYTLNGITNNTGLFTGLPEGIYPYTVEDLSGCSTLGEDTITAPDAVTPQFAQIGPLCQFSIPPAMPLTSLNGITGTWIPATISTAAPGAYIFAFTPGAGECAYDTTLTIIITEELTPQFAQIGPLCQNSTPPALPLTSLNGVNGTWSPAVINTTITGTVIYTFTPDSGQCALGVQMDITISTGMSPEFAQIGPLCLNSTPPLLPLTSDNGINGTWNPSTINTGIAGSVTYTFTASTGQCAADTTMIIVVSDTIKPSFAQIGPLCLNSTPPELPLISNDSIAGTWSPAVISTSSVGTTTYTFTPDGAGCAFPTTMEITVSSPEIISLTITNSANGQSNGHITIDATGTEPMQYSLDGINWQSSPSFTQLAPGMGYTAWVMDANGCIVSQDFDIGNVVVGEIELVSGRVTDCVGAIRQLNVNVYNFKDVASFRVQLTYDPMILQFAGFSNINNSLVATNLIGTEVSPGLLEISYTHPGQVTIADGDSLFNLIMKGVAPGVTDLKWQWIECVVMTSLGYVEPSTLVADGVAEIFANPELTAYKDDAFCAGDSTTLYVESNMPNLTYTWTHPRGIKHIGDTWNLDPLSVMDSGRYIVEAKIDQCFTLDTVNIIVYPAPDLHISYADTICFGNPVVLDPGGDFDSYEWNDGSNMSTLIAYEAGIYWVKIVDFNGCRAVDFVNLEPCIMEVLIPNAFTPNGDGLNDDFKPIFIGFEPTKYRMDIYSKWGQLLFTTSNLEEGWDGTINGVLAPHDTFVYVISYEAPAFVTRKGLHSPVTGRVSVLR